MNAFQLFAARYQMKRNRDQLITDIQDTLKAQLLYTDPDRYNQIFEAELIAAHQPLTMAGRPVEEVVQDLDEYDRYFAELESKRHLTGGEVLALSDSEGWV